MSVRRRLWTAWKAFALWLGRIQTAILLSIVYHLTIGPIGLTGQALKRDLVGLARPSGKSYWVPLSRITSTLERAEKQF